ncbi:LOW QUALITY PROTEIN: protein SMAX1-like [Elaeis guineensis]|uniref:LOW QUALITY PROTEIN: protein SMAX1-like n=1 Tax=Elaeis guineensis var. tenera TaxID=51953 RepID=A0A6I9QQE9_ELAGV|nr:LOW QUALITY PROTEIN: protein SMAX1-like [Elaeis guineensis]
MRAALSTIQQTLTPEAAGVLTHSITEAARRNHGQTTPLHVAATLLAAPSGLLRQACVRSHPHSSHPLQCRALELCFSVALDRLPTSSSSSSSNPNPTRDNSTNSNAPTNSSSGVAEPPISNALMAALKRAQAHQRRGCPEQQQQPLLAVKVELEQLVISILDDPSVSRVMREASFSSTAVKATIEQSLASSSPSSSSSSAAPSTTNSPSAASALGINLAHRPPARNLYINPRLHQHQANAAAGGGADLHRREGVNRVMDILMRSKKRNPVLVGDSDPDAVMREVLQRIESSDAPPPLRAAQVISLHKESTVVADRSQIPSRIRELGSLIEARIAGGHSMVLNLGDLKWLVECPPGVGASLGPAPAQPQPIISEGGRAAVVEMGRLLKSFGEGGRLWLVGTASCATYLRCQVYHPTMENDWDLQAVPIAPRSPLPCMFPRPGGNGILSSSVETLAPMKGFAAAIPPRRPPESTDPSRRTILCQQCMESYERELAKLVAKEFEKSSSKPDAHQTLPQWLQLAKLSNGGSARYTTDHVQPQEQDSMWKQSTGELLKKWRDTCSLHSNFQPPVLLGSERPPAPALSMPVLSNSSMLTPRPPSEPKSTLSGSLPRLQMNSNQSNITRTASPAQSMSPPASPVKTDLVLGQSKDNSLEKTHKELAKDLTGCAQDGFSDQQKAKIAGISDVDSFKRLFKGLIDKVSWQPEAASTVATAVMQCKSGNGKRRSFGPKGDTWLLFIGPDKAGKRKMATAVSELVFGTSPVTVNFGGIIPRSDGDDGETTTNSRGRTSLDRVVEAIRGNPFSVVVLEDIDRADGLVHGSIKRAMERGRLPDSYGREVSLGNVIFILTANWLPEELSLVRNEKRELDPGNGGCQLELSIGDSPRKRRPDWLSDDDRNVKPRKESSGGTGLSLDLNLAAGADNDVGEGSRNSSDLTVEREIEKRRLAVRCSTSSSAASELMELVDDAVVFKPVESGNLRRKVIESISPKFAAVVGGGRSILIDDDADSIG